VTPSNEAQASACLNCGSGYILTSTYRDLLARRQVKEMVPALCPTCFFAYGPLPKQLGRVKWFNPGKRFGFIVSETGEDIFFHRDQLLPDVEGTPHKGQQVRFHVHRAFKGPEALNVELVEE
jgi:CspA family cold shock protein